MNNEQQALVQRWQGFLAKIGERLDELIREAQQGVDMLAEQHPGDYMALGNAMSGLDHRVRQLRDKVQETWDGQVDEKFTDADDGDGFLDLGLDMKGDFEIALDEKWAVWKTRANADYYRKMWPLVEARSRPPVHCNGCGAQLTETTPTATVSLSCPHCNAVTQSIPDALVQGFYGGGGHALGEERAEPIRHQIERFRAQVDRWRRARDWAPEPIESMEQWERMEFEYWRTYAQAKAEFLGQPLDQELVDSRMTFFRKYNLENDQRWRKAKGL